MRKNLLLLILFSISLFGCGGAETPMNSTNNALMNRSPSNASNTNNPLIDATPPPEPTSNNAPTLAPVYKAYCDALSKKDDAAIRRVVDSTTLKLWQEDMREEGSKSIAEYLSGEQGATEQCEARNEQITGDSAVAEVRSKAYPNGIKIVFVKENGQWKLTNKSPSVPPK